MSEEKRKGDVLLEPSERKAARIALLTGITGQDGSYLAEFLLNKNYVVHGIIRRSSSLNTSRIDHLKNNPKFQLFLHCGDMCDSANLSEIVKKVRPDEIYNLAAQSYVHASFEMPEYTANVDALGTLRLLDAIRAASLQKSVRFYQASTSELFGKVSSERQTELTPFHPRSPYAVAKLFAYWATINYREAYGMFAVNGILFNHESPRRGLSFVTRKTTMAVAQIYYGLQDCVYLGNIDAQRDWGHARDYVEAMWMMLQVPNPDDFLIATGKTHSIREFVEVAFSVIDFQITWQQKGVDEVGMNQHGRVIVRIDPKNYRPSETDFLQGDAQKACAKLGWMPKTDFRTLIREMVLSDLAIVRESTNDITEKKC